MPVTGTAYPILSLFLCAVHQHTGMPAQPLDAVASSKAGVDSEPSEPTKRFPKGVVLGKDGKP